MKIKETVLKIIGWLLVCFAVFILTVGIGMIIDKDSRHSSSGLPIALCSLIFFIPAGISLLIAKRIRRENDLITTVTQLLKSYGRITITDLSAKISVPPQLAIKMLAKAITKGRISGSFDRTTDEFVADGARPSSKNITHCPRCGSGLSSVYLEGDTIKCKQCGSFVG